MHVLIVDDNEINRTFLKAAIEPFATVRCASDGIEAVRLCAAQAFELVLMDLRMPRLNGVDAARQARRGDNSPQRIIAMSAEKPEQLPAGLFDAIVRKPLSREQIRKLLDASSQIERNDDTVSQPFDDDVGLVATGGNHQLLQTLRQMLRRDLASIPSNIDRAMKAGDVTTLRDELHKVAGAASYCGANELKSAALRLGDAVKSKAGVAAAHVAFSEAVDKVLDHP